MPDYKILRRVQPPEERPHVCKLPNRVRRHWEGLKPGAQVECTDCGKVYELQWTGGYDWGPQWVAASGAASGGPEQP